MKHKTSKLARFKQWILSVVIKRYSITPLTNEMMLENNRRYLKLKDEILNVL
jgi:hypothetical protein